VESFDLVEGCCSRDALGSLTVKTSAELQGLLRERLGPGSPSDMTEGTLVVLPSISFPEAELKKIVGIEFYEERLLFMLLQLRSPDLRVVYITSLRVEEPIVDYYLSFIEPETRPGDRLYLIALWDPRPVGLSSKLLTKNDAMERLAQLAEGESCLLSFNVTDAEAEVSERAGIPLYGCPPELVSLGSKSGSRQVARTAEVGVLDGSEDLFSLDAVSAALRDLAARRPDAREAVIKLNLGFSGQGNAIVSLADAEVPVSDLPTVFCADEEDWTSFGTKIEADGAIVEEMRRAEGLRSPSVQMRIAPDGSTQVISTHDQILGAPDDQVYLGCRFPADPTYRLEIQAAGCRIAKILAERGVMGSFGVDFVFDPAEGALFLSEINLRMGGTTHPFLMTKAVTGGVYDEGTGELLVDGAPRAYVASDNLKSPDFVGLLPEQLIGALDRTGLAFDRRTGTGVLLHLLGALKKYGKFGMVCVAPDLDEATEMYGAVEEAVALLAERHRKLRH